MSSAVVTSPASRVLSGILLTSLAYLLFSLQDAFIKLLVVGVSVWQIMFMRSAVITAGCLLLGGPALVRDTAQSPIVKPMMLRSFLILGAWLCYYTAARDLQLAELTTIYFAAPVIITVLSVFVLHETVPMLRWAAVIIGFVGVFVACDPASIGLTLPIVLVLCAAFLWALSIVLLRKIALKERTTIQIVLNNGFFMILVTPPMLVYWQTPDGTQTILMVAVGALGGLAQLALFDGMKRAEASVLAPFEYTSLIWSFLLGYMIWGDLPRPAVIVGAVLIVSAGLIVIFGERRRRS
jgi:drug/metabolite transporter (DMT)-like permease